MWQEYGHIIVQVVIMVFLISTLYMRSKDEKSPILQYIAQWLFIFFLIILAYTYKDGLVESKERILGALIPGYAASYTKGEIVIHQNKDGHFYLNAMINGNKVRLLVDTGASTTVLSQQDAKNLGLLVAGLQYNKVMQTAGGLVPAAAVTLQRIQIGEIEFYDIPAMVSSRDDLNISVAGISFLQYFSSYKVKGNKLYLYAARQ